MGIELPLTSALRWAYVCDGGTSLCRYRVEGEACATEDACPPGLYCADDIDQCRDGSTGDECDATEDCDEIDDVCGGDTGTCRDRVEGDDCSDDLECPGSVPICSIGSICQDGGAGDGCEAHEDCGAGFHCAESNQCASGEPFDLGDSCVTDTRCQSSNCSKNHCAPAGFAYIPPGTFCMGAPDGSTECMSEVLYDPDSQWDERPVHEVTLTGGFFLQETEVTQQQWSALGFTNPSNFVECGLDCPVEMVNWWEAVAYVNALSASEGLEPCYTLEGCVPSGAGTGIACNGITVSDPRSSENPYHCEGYRLPMEAEWEYAYRAGTRTAFYNGDANLDAIGWYDGNSGFTTHIVSTLNEVDPKTPNDWGLYDMSGNVREWVWDWWQNGYYASSPPSDPPGGSSSYRGTRGGSLFDNAPHCRAAIRDMYPPGERNVRQGFRPARSVLP